MSSWVGGGKPTPGRDVGFEIEVSERLLAELARLAAILEHPAISGDERGRSRALMQAYLTALRPWLPLVRGRDREALNAALRAASLPPIA